MTNVWVVAEEVEPGEYVKIHEGGDYQKAIRLANFLSQGEYHMGGINISLGFGVYLKEEYYGHA